MDIMKYYIYIVKSPTNKYYIGLTSRNLNIRKKQHILDSKNGSNLKFHKAIRKYDERLLWKEISVVFDRELAFYIEKSLINFYNSYKSGYNMTPGGDGEFIYGKYSQEGVLLIAKKYSKKSEWIKYDYGSYQFAKNNDELFLKCTEHMINGYIEYKDEDILNDAKKYNTLREWRTSSKNIYQVAQRRKNLFDKCKSFLISEKHHWLDSELLILSKQYSTKKDWELDSPASYRAARRRPELYKTCTIHMEPKSKKRTYGIKCSKISRKIEESI